MNMLERHTRIRLVGLCFVFTAGFVIGAFFQNSESIRDIIFDYSCDVVQTRIHADSVSVFLDSFLLNFCVLVIICFVSVSQAGAIIKHFIFLCYGIGFGALISSLVCDSGVHGLGLSIMILLPGFITSVCAMLIFSASFPVQTENKSSFIRKCTVFFTYVFLIAFSAGIDVVSAVLYKALR